MKSWLFSGIWRGEKLMLQQQQKTFPKVNHMTGTPSKQCFSVGFEIKLKNHDLSIFLLN